MTEDSSEQCFPHIFVNAQNGASNIQFSPNSVTKTFIENPDISEISPQQSVQNNACALYRAAIPAELAENLPEGTVFQIMSDARALASVPTTDSVCEAVIYQDLCLENSSNTNSLEASNVVSIPNYAIEISEQSAVNSALSNAIKFSGNISDIDLSFLTESDEPNASCDEIQNIVQSPQKQLQPEAIADDASKLPDSLSEGTSEILGSDLSNDATSPDCDTVIVDVSKPIQLCQNTLIVVNGVKCVMQQDPQTGQVVAYPVKEEIKPKKKRGRPRKSSKEPSVPSEDSANIVELEICQVSARNNRLSTESLSDEESAKEKGLLEFVNKDGALVRRSSRKRRKARMLCDYETGNLNQELGSDVDEYKNKDDDDDRKKRTRAKSPGRPRKYRLADGKRSRDSLKQFAASESEPTQAFLIQTADGQTMMVQIPLSIIPEGMSLQDVAQRIANNFNIAAQQQQQQAEKGTEQQPGPSLGSLLNMPELLNPQHVQVETEDVQSIASTSNNSFKGVLSALNNTENVALPTTPEEILKLAEESLCDISPPNTDTGSVVASISKKPCDTSNNFLYSEENPLEAYDDSRAQAVNEKFPDNFMAEGELTLISEQHLEPHPDSNKELIEELVQGTTQPEPVAANVGTLYEQPDVINKCNFDGKQNSKSANIHFLREKTAQPVENIEEVPLEPLENVKAVGNDHIVNLDHEYESCIIESVVSSSKTASSRMCDVVQMAAKESSRFGDSIICTTAQTDGEISDTPGNTVKLLMEVVGTHQISDGTLPGASSDSSNNKTITMGPTFVDIQKCFGTSIEIKSLPTLNSASVTSMSPALVIPLPQKMLPLLMAKAGGSDSVIKETDTYRCSACDYTSGDHDTYCEHLKTHSDVTLKCKCCKYVCLEENELIDHYKKLHPRCICTECDFIAEQPNMVKRHMYRHIEKGITCELCDKKYKDHYILKMHMKMVHMPSEVFYKCEVCSKEFNRKAHMKRHLRTHASDKPYKCSFCDYRGCEKSDITKHMLIHAEPKHKCEICGKAFRHIKNKELHLKRHNNQRDFKCGLCDFFGYTFTDIRKHIERRHGEEKGSTVLICNKCDHVCRTHDQLKTHQNSGQCKATKKISAHSPVSVPNEITPVEKVPIKVDVPDVTPGSIPVDKPVSVESIASLASNHLILNSIGKLINSKGQIIISGLDSVESLPGANLTIISSQDDATNKETVMDPVQVNESLLKLFDNVVFSNGQNQNVLCPISS